MTAEERAAWVRFVAVLEILPRVLDSQLVRDEGITHFDYFVLAMLSEAPDATVRMAALATMTNATPPRLSKVIDRLAAQGLVERRACPGDGRATNAVLTERGWAKVRQAAPGHVAAVRRYVIDPLSADQIFQLGRHRRAAAERARPRAQGDSADRDHRPPRSDAARALSLSKGAWRGTLKGASTSSAHEREGETRRGQLPEGGRLSCRLPSARR